MRTTLPSSRKLFKAAPFINKLLIPIFAILICFSNDLSASTRAGANNHDAYLITAYNTNGSNKTTENNIASPTIVVSAVTGSITSCPGMASVNPNIQQFTVSGNSLSTDIIATAPVGFELSLSLGTGYSNSVTLTQSGGVVSNAVVFVRSAASATGSISGNVTLTSTGATSQAAAVAGLINTLPTVNGVSNQTVVNGASTTAINFTGAANTFNWVNNTPGIGLAASGTSNIPAFVAVNNGTSPVTATITVTPQSLGLVYVVELFGNVVEVINTASHTVVSRIQVGASPFGASVSPNGSRVYVTNGGSDNVSVINTATNTVVGTINVGSRPQGIVVSPDGSRVYVANYISSSVSVINTTNNAVITTIPVGANPVGIAESPDGSNVYTSNATDGTVSVVNTVTNTMTATIAVGSSRRGVLVTPDGSKVYVVNTSSNTVSVINTTTNAVISTITVGASPLGISISPDGSRAYVANDGSNNVSVINTSTNTVVTTIAAGSNPYGISIRPDGSEVYVENLGSDNVSVINTATNTVSALVSLNGSPFSLGNFITGGTGCSGTPITFTITVNSTSPVISSSGILTTLTSTYGAASPSTSFNLSGTNMTAGILVTPPAGFEVSTNNTTFSNTVTVGAAGAIASTIVYVRLAAADAANTYSGNIVLSSAGTGNVSIATVSSTVARAALTITANNQNTSYGQTIPVLTASYSGFVNGESQASLTTLPAITTTGIASSPTGTYAVTVGGAVDANYTISFIPGTLTIGKAALTITANNQNMIYGQTLPALTISYSGFVNGDTPASLTTSPTLATAIAASPAGTYPITASAAVDANYTISYLPGVLTIGKAALTITANNLGTTYGQALPVLTAGYIGFVNGDTQASLTTQPLLSTTGTAASPAGTYPVTANGAVDANYTISYASGTLTIGKAILTITANNQNTLYGQALPQLTANYNGFVNGDSQASLISAATAATTATTSSPSGAYDINVNGASSPNYTINYAKGTLTIGQAPLTITADDQSKTYGQINPILTFSYNGFVNGDTQANLVSAAVANTAAATPSPAGAYDINVSGASSPNYVINYLKGTLTIGQIPLTVTADNQSRIYGQPNSVFTFSYSGFVNGESQASLTTPPTAATIATTTTVTGSYPITPAGAVSSNYVFNYLNGTLTITTATRTLTFNGLATKTYGAPDFNAGATASSGEPIIYSSDNAAVATIINGLIHIIGVGAANITATVAANSNYTSVPTISLVLTVSKADQTIDLASIPTLMQGGTYDLSGSKASSGLPVIFTITDPAIISLAGQTLTGLVPGTTVITASQAGDANYNAAVSVTAVITVSNLNGNEILVHKVVSPNGDGINDILFIEGIKNYPVNTVTVVNRNGVKVFEVNSYDNSTRLFDGRSNITGALQQAGTYFYVVEFTANGERKRRTGYFVLKYY